jgi:hypothetical protein
MAAFAAFEQAQSPKLIQAAHGLAHRSIGKTQFGGYRHYRKLQAELAYNERMAQEIGVDGAIENGQAETRGENILKLHPEESGVQFFGFHVRILEKRKQIRKAEAKVKEANSSTTANRAHSPRLAARSWREKTRV